MTTERPKGSEGERRSWWSTLPGVLTALAALLTAVSGLVALLVQTGMFGAKSPPTADKGTAVTSAPAAVGDRAATDPLPSAATTAAPAGATRPPNTAALRAQGFRGTVVTLADGSIVTLTGPVREWLAGGATLLLKSGHSIDFERLSSFEILRFRSGDSEGEAQLTLADGRTMRAEIRAIELRGSNDLGDFTSPFDRVKRVDFVR